jgi:hypothetical protein
MSNYPPMIIEYNFFFVIKPVKKKGVSETRLCPHCHKDYFHKEVFCNICGHSIEVTTKEYEYTVTDFSKLVSEVPEFKKRLFIYQDYCWQPQDLEPYHMYLFKYDMVKDAPIDFKFPRAFVFESKDIPDLSLPELTNEKFAREELDFFIKAFKDFYGEDSIELRSGLYSYTH